MKKILISLSLIIFCSQANAYILEETVSNPYVVKSMGYSDSAMQIVENVKIKSQGISSGKYVPVASQMQTKGLPALYHRLKVYIDPAQDDGYFGFHEINFYNKPFPMVPVMNEL